MYLSLSVESGAYGPVAVLTRFDVRSESATRSLNTKRALYDRGKSDVYDELCHL